MNMKIIILTLILMSIFSSVTFAACPSNADTDYEFRHVLKKALIDYLTNPSESKIDLNEVKDMIVFYLTITDWSTADCDVSGTNSGTKISIVINDADTNIYEGIIPKCSDGTEYGECSSKKPKYCFAGMLIDKCSICSCPSGQECKDNNKCVSIEIEEVSTGEKEQWTMAFVVVTKPGEPNATPEQLDILDKIKNEFSTKFSASTLDRASMDTSDDIYQVTHEGDSQNRGRIMEDILDNNFYHDNDYDHNFYSFYFTFGEHKTSLHYSNTYLLPSPPYKGKTRLLGWNFLGGVDELIKEGKTEEYSIAADLRILFHETGHQWGAYIGNDKNFLNMYPFGYHWGGHLPREFANGGGNSAMGGGSWIRNDDGTYSQDPALFNYIEAMKKRQYRDITLFAMGILDRSEVDPVVFVDYSGSPGSEKFPAIIYTIDEIIPPVNPDSLTNNLYKCYDVATGEWDFNQPIIWESSGDVDKDGLPSWLEIQGELGYKTDPLTADTDGDGIDDYQEIKHHFDPLSPTSYPLIIDPNFYITEPKNDELVSGVITIKADPIPYSRWRDFGSILFQYKSHTDPDIDSSWVDIGVDDSYPSSIEWDTDLVPGNNTYDIRAVIRYSDGIKAISSSVTVTLGEEHPAPCTYLLEGIQDNFLATCGDVKYNPVVDLNKDRIIDISDFGLLSVNIDNESWCNEKKALTENPCENTKLSPCDSYGDLNNDSYLNDTDITLIGNCILEKPECTSEQKLRSDVNNDGEVNVLDQTAVTRYISGADDTLPACSKTPPCDSYGDINGNGYINLRDLNLLAQCILFMCTSEQELRADVNGDGVVNVLDLTALARYILGLDDTFSVCG